MILSTSPRGTRRTPPLTPDRGAGYVSLLEFAACLDSGRAFLLTTRDETDAQVSIPLTIGDLDLLREMCTTHLCAATEADVHATDVHTGDTVLGVIDDPAQVLSITDGSSVWRSLSLQTADSRRFTVTVAGTSKITVRLPRPEGEQ